MPTERSTLSSAQRCAVQRRTLGSPAAASVITSSFLTSERDDAVSALQLQPDHEDIGVVTRAGQIGLQLVVAILALERELPVEFVGQRGAKRGPGVLALQGPIAGADIIVEAITRLHRPDQPAAQRVIDLHADVAAQYAGDALHHGLLAPRACGQCRRREAGGVPD